MPIYIKTKDGRKIKGYTYDEVFGERLKSESYRKALKKEYARLTVVSQLRKLRQKKKLTQKDLAKKAGVSLSSIARVENGNPGLSFSTLSQIAKAFDKEIQIV